jgi:hypothetical protein
MRIGEAPAGPVSHAESRGAAADELEYTNMVEVLKPYTDKGRPISIAFLNWFLEHI